jgi:hypothetical protein
MRRSPFLLLILWAAIFEIRAELPPSVYQERQAKAPEALVIKVRSVSKQETIDKDLTSIEFTVKAEVEKVERSATKLSPGALIEIHYTQTHYKEPMVGPSEVPALKEGQVCPAYLAGDGKIYRPAGGGYSFETVR